MIPESRRFPNLFHRVFLSHLFVLVLAFATALVLIDYLFVDGITHFLSRSPIILVPVVLAMIGIVGLLALWTAGAAALPLDRAVDALREHDPAAALARLLPDARIDEVATLVDAMQRRLRREPARRPFFLRIDRHGNVLDCDVDTAARLGAIPEKLRRVNLRSVLPEKGDFAALRENSAAARTSGVPASVTLRFHGAAARILPTDCLLYPLSGDHTLLIGFPGPPA